MTHVTNSIFKDGYPFYLNTIMFAPAVIGQGTPEQQAIWLKKALNYEIIGTFAQVRTCMVSTLIIIQLVEKSSIYSGNIEVCYCVHKHLILDLTLSQLNLLSTVTFETVVLKMLNVVFWIVIPCNLFVGFKNFITVRSILILSFEVVF